MKKRFGFLICAVLILFCLSVAAADVSVNAVSFPDKNFREFILKKFNLPWANDPRLTDEMIRQTTELDVSKKLISDLTGIGYFTSLQKLDCSTNQLKELNTNGCTALTELNCGDNRLTSLTVSKSTALQKLDCYNNLLTELDVSNNTALEMLWCQDNQLATLITGSIPHLRILDCMRNKLTSLDVSGNHALERLDLTSNKMTALKSSPELQKLVLKDNQLTSLALIQSAPSRCRLNLDNNQFTSLDLSAFPDLESLTCDNNQLTSLDLSAFPNIEGLSCNNNKLTSLNLKDCSKLTSLNCDFNQLSFLEPATLKNLKHLSCNGNKLTSLDVSQNTELEELSCYRNGMATLKLNNKKLYSLDCQINQIKALNLAGYTKLETVECANNEIGALIVSGCTELDKLECGKNNLTILDISETPILKELVENNEPEESGSFRMWDKQVSFGYYYRLWIDKEVELKLTSTPLTSISLNQTTATLNRTADDKNPTLQLEVQFNPANATNQDVSWTSSNPDAATVDGTGLVTAQGKGKAVITCTSAENSAITATCEVTVAEQAPSSITLNKTKATMTLTSKVKKPTLQLKAEVSPKDVLDTELEWSSSNPKIAKVDQDGKVTALKKGKAVITCKAKNASGVSAKCEITVKEKQISKIVLNKKKATLKKGKTLKLKVKTIKPSDAFNKKFKWTTSDKKVATVDKNGKVKAVGQGTCIITCTATDGSGKKATCRITVK